MTEHIDDNIQAQILGLTDSHIHYFAQNLKRPNNKVGIHQQMLPAFEALVAKAMEASIDLKIASGFRPFDRQLHIWNNKFSGKTAIKNSVGENVIIDELSAIDIIQSILLFSALPGASRHHWGCDIDVYAPNLLNQNQPLQLEPWEYDRSGPMAKLSAFLAEEASTFGFYFPYDSYRNGVAAEPWHLSYTPLANNYQQAIDASALNQLLASKDILGKKEILENLTYIIKQFVLNVNPDNLSTNTQTIGTHYG